MYWLYFARDFYRAAGATPQECAPQPLAPRAIVATIAVRNVEFTPKAELPKRTVAKRQTEYAVRSEPTEAAPASSLHAYLQRLSIDGEHAFGVWDEEAGFSMFSREFRARHRFKQRRMRRA